MNKTAYAFVSLLVIFYVGGTVFYFVQKETPERVELKKSVGQKRDSRLVTPQWSTITMRPQTTLMPKAQLSERIFEIDDARFFDVSWTHTWTHAAVNGLEFWSIIAGRFTIDSLHVSCHGGATFDYLVMIVAKDAEHCVESIDIETFFNLIKSMGKARVNYIELSFEDRAAHEQFIMKSNNRNNTLLWSEFENGEMRGCCDLIWSIMFKDDESNNMLC